MPKVIFIVLALLCLVSSSVYGEPLVNTTFFELDLREALQEISMLTGVNIMVTDEVSGVVTVDLVEKSLEESLELLLAGTDYEYILVDDYYLVGSVYPDSAIFPSIAETGVFSVTHQDAAAIADRLAYYPAHIGHIPGSSVLAVTASPRTFKAIAEEIACLDTPEAYAQVAYTLQILELNELRGRSVALQLAEFTPAETVGSLVQLIVNENVLDMLRSASFATLRLEAEERKGKSAVLETPQIVTAIKQAGSMRLLQDEVLLFSELSRYETLSSGLEITVIPQQIEMEKNQVFSEIELGSPGSPRDLTTTVRLPVGEPTLIGVVRQQATVSRKANTAKEIEAQTRYFAMYITAEPLAALTDQHVFAAGNLSGLSDLLWGEPSLPALRESYLNLLFTKKSVFPDVTGTGWVTPRVRLSLAIERTLQNYYSFGLEGLLFDQDLMLGTYLTGSDLDEPMIAVGVSDRVELSEEISLAAGVCPLVFAIQEATFDDPQWWVEGEFQGKRFLLNIRFNWDDSHKQLRSNAGLRLSDHLWALAGYRTDLDGDNVFLLGLRLGLWR